MNWLNEFWWRKKPDNVPPQPTPSPQPESDDKTPWLRVWLTLRTVNLKELWPVFISVPAIVFFAISGLIAWLYLLLRGIMRFIKGIFCFWTK